MCALTDNTAVNSFMPASQAKRPKTQSHPQLVARLGEFSSALFKWPFKASLEGIIYINECFLSINASFNKQRLTP